MKYFTLQKEKAGLLVIDMQDKILQCTERLAETVDRAQLAICGLQEMGIPLLATEQNPSGLGPTTEVIRYHLVNPPLAKTTFSCWRDENCRQAMDELQRSQWILMGVEAHICVMQTAYDLIQAGHQVVILNDAVTSRSIFDYSTAIAEMRDMGARIASTEIVLFELLESYHHPQFRTISGWIKNSASEGCGSSNCCQGH